MGKHQGVEYIYCQLQVEFKEGAASEHPIEADLESTLQMPKFSENLGLRYYRASTDPYSSLLFLSLPTFSYTILTKFLFYPTFSAHSKKKKICML